MNKMSHSDKLLLFGGAAKTKTTSYKKSSSSTGLKKKSKVSSLYKNINNYTHNAGFAMMASASVISNLVNSIDALWNGVNSGDQNKNSSFSHNGHSSSKMSKFSDAIRPAVRFGAYPHRSGITFGLPWFY